jgi:hypothetical protein
MLNTSLDAAVSSALLDPFHLTSLPVSTEYAAILKTVGSKSSSKGRR